MIRKRVKAGIIAAALVVSAFFASRSASYVHAADPAKISDNDLSKTKGAVGMADYELSGGWVCPTNSDYYVSNVSKLDENHKWVRLTDEEWDAFRARVEAQNPVDGSDESLDRYNKGSKDFLSINCLSNEVTVVDGSTTTTLPSSFDPIWEDWETYYYLDARKASGEWDFLFDKYNLSSDYTFSWSDYLSDEYVYYVLYSRENITDYSTGVLRFFVAEDKMDAMRALISAATISDVKPLSGVKNTMYRLYNPNSGEHLYTANVEEAKNLKNVGWKYEDYAWKAPESSSTPVYRLYNPNSGEHHYTKDAAEKDFLVGLGWNDEGIGWYSDDNQKRPLYRLYNPNATGQYEAGGHHYTKDTAERDKLITAGWKDEGIGWYGL